MLILDWGYRIAYGAACVLVPLGLWKAVEILAWVFQHVSVRWM